MSGVDTPPAQKRTGIQEQMHLTEMYPVHGSTKPPTVARLTAGGRGAVATIRVVGELNSSPTAPDSTSIDPLFSAANGIPLSQQPLQKIAFGQWGTVPREDLTVCRLSKDVLEIHCHGGDSAVERVLSDLEKANCRLLDWQTQLTLETDILEAECQQVLSRTTTWRTTQIALEQANGLLRTTFAHLLTLEDESALFRSLDDLIDWSDFGLHLSVPWSVVLTGRPNVGKSSLINALLGYQRAIVFDQPGTTRDVVTGETAFEGWPVVLADTAGIRRNAPGLESAGMALAEEKLRAADLQLIVIDLSQPPSEEDHDLLRKWPQALIVGQKSDLPNQWSSGLPRETRPVSAQHGLGLIELQQQLVRRLVPRTPPAGTPLPITPRQIELIRVARHAESAIDRRTAVQRLQHT